MTNLATLSKYVLGALSLILAIGCATDSAPSIVGTEATIVERGAIVAFPAGLLTKDAEIVHCEASAIVYDGTDLIIGSDKPIPHGDTNIRSAVFFVNYSKFPAEEIRYYTDKPFLEAIKFEDFTITPDQRYVLATTGFDRIHFDGSSKWDNYNTLMFWPKGEPGKVKLVSPSTRDGVTSSIQIRKMISLALATKTYPAGPPYFKIEGLAAIPGQKLLFGIREQGATYVNPDYVIRIVSVSYSIRNDELILSDDFSIIFDYDVSVKGAELGQSPGLSSIEYDSYNNRLYMLTSYEPKNQTEVKDTEIGAFLWVISMENLSANRAPDLVVIDSVSTPLHFAHKAEGLAVINNTRVIAVHDDDRVLGRPEVDDIATQFSRKANEAAYTVVDFVKGTQPQLH